MRSEVIIVPQSYPLWVVYVATDGALSDAHLVVAWAVRADGDGVPSPIAAEVGADEGMPRTGATSGEAMTRARELADHIVKMHAAKLVRNDVPRFKG